MEVRVGSYYFDESKNAQREIHVTLDQADGAELFKDNWTKMPPETRFRKLSAIADILAIRYAISRGFRFEEAGNEEIQAIVTRDLK